MNVDQAIETAIWFGQNADELKTTETINRHLNRTIGKATLKGIGFTVFECFSTQSLKSGKRNKSTLGVSLRRNETQAHKGAGKEWFHGKWAVYVAVTWYIEDKEFLGELIVIC